MAPYVEDVIYSRRELISPLSPDNLATLGNFQKCTKDDGCNELLVRLRANECGEPRFWFFGLLKQDFLVDRHLETLLVRPSVRPIRRANVTAILRGTLQLRQTVSLGMHFRSVRTHAKTYRTFVSAILKVYNNQKYLQIVIAIKETWNQESAFMTESGKVNFYKFFELIYVLSVF